MSCKRLRARTRKEQDFYLQWAPREPTKAERLDFLRYDSHGGALPLDNPILRGKARYHLLATEWRNARFMEPGYEGMWPGGGNLVSEERENPQFLSMLRREFGDKTVSRWFSAAGLFLEDHVYAMGV